MASRKWISLEEAAAHDRTNLLLMDERAFWPDPMGPFLAPLEVEIEDLAQGVERNEWLGFDGHA